MVDRSVQDAAPRKSPKAGLFHLAWKSRKSGGITTSSTAPAAPGNLENTTRTTFGGAVGPLDPYDEARSSFDDGGVGGLIQTAVGWGGCLGRAWVKRSGLRAYAASSTCCRCS